MSTSYELPLGRRLALKEAVVSAASEHESQGVAPRADALDGAIFAVKDYVSSVLLGIALAHNENKTLQQRLPHEIWTLVWQDLPLDDRISVTHVCHSWRALALSTPVVWSKIDIVSDARVSHPIFSTCSHVHASTQPSRRSPTNLLWMPDILDRGGSSPISFLVALTGSRSDTRTLLETLGAVLELHSSRLISIDFTFTPTVDTGSFTTFFAQFTRLPVLRSLRLHILREDPPDDLLGMMVSHNIGLPLLESLELGEDVWFPDRRYVEFPTLTRLTMTRPAQPEKLVDALEACPALQQLRLSLTNDTARIRKRYARNSPKLSSLLSRLRAVWLSDVWEESLVPALDVFAQQSLHQFGIDCTDIGRADIPRAMDLLAHVPASVRLEICTNGDKIQLASTAPSGQNRALTFSLGALDVVLATVWSAVSPASLEIFTTTWTLWPRVCQSIAGASRLRQLEIGLPAESPHTPPEIRDASLPELRKLILRAAFQIRAPRPWVRDLVLSLRLGRPLEELLLVNVELTDVENNSLAERDWGHGVCERLRCMAE